jgi:primase-polymerase (primpol)-like protein
MNPPPQNRVRVTAPAAVCPADVTIASLASVPCWVAWQTEPRRSIASADAPLGPLTKMPYAPNGHGRAASNDPATWGMRTRAEERLRTLPRRHGAAGIGVMLGTRLDAPALGLGGVDLDSCRDPESGALAPWASAVISRFATYCEVSPSGTGVKLFFQYRLSDRAAMHALGVNHG